MRAIFVKVLNHYERHRQVIPGASAFAAFADPTRKYPATFILVGTESTARVAFFPGLVPAAPCAPAGSNYSISISLRAEGHRRGTYRKSWCDGNLEQQRRERIRLGPMSIRASLSWACSCILAASASLRASSSPAWPELVEVSLQATHRACRSPYVPRVSSGVDFI